MKFVIFKQRIGATVRSPEGLENTPFIISIHCYSLKGMILMKFQDYENNSFLYFNLRESYHNFYELQGFILKSENLETI